MPPLNVWFYNPVNDTEGMVNKVVAYADPPFCHCEIQFPDSQACSIYMGSTVTLKKRSFDRASYTLVCLYVPDEQVQHAYTLCSELHQRAVRFSSMQMLACLYPWQSGSSDSKYTFCSKLITGVLVEAGILPMETKQAITPSALHRLLHATVSSRATPTEALDIRPGETLVL